MLTHVHTYVHTCRHIHTHTHAHTHTHTYTHTHAQQMWIRFAEEPISISKHVTYNHVYHFTKIQTASLFIG